MLSRDSQDRGIRIQRPGKDRGTGGNAQKPEQDDPGQSQGLIAIDGLLPRRQDGPVVTGVRVDGIEQDVEVDDLHLRSRIFLAISSSSSTAASASALSSFILGAPIAWVCSR